VTLGEVGIELAAEAAKAPPVPLPPVPEAAKAKAGAGPSKGPAPGAKDAKEKEPPPLLKDPFKEALFDRFVELNGYLARFVFVEIGEGFLALNEVTQRVLSSLYRGSRPLSASLQAWFKWMEFLGYLKLVGFRHKLSEVGLEALSYLKEIPEEELVEKGALAALPLDDSAPADTRKFLTAEELGAGPNTEPPAAAPVGAGVSAAPPASAEEAGSDEEDAPDFGPDAPPPVLDDEEGGAASPPLSRGSAAQKSDEVEEEEEISEEEEEAIRELFGEVHRPPPKPQAAASAAPQNEGVSPASPAEGEARGPGVAPAPRKPFPEAVEGPPPGKPEAPAPLAHAAALAEKTVAAEAPAEEAAQAAAAAAPARAPAAPAGEMDRLFSPPLLPAGGAGLSVSRAERVDILAAHWEVAPGRRPLSAADLGLTTERARGRRALALFYLLAAAILLEAEAPFALKMATLRDLGGLVENVFERDWSLERVLEALGLLDGPREIGPVEERLLHLPRLKRALSKKDALAALDRAVDERTEALRRLSGYAVAGGAYWVEREMRRLGLW
jgi:hypothetical protein